MSTPYICTAAFLMDPASWGTKERHRLRFGRTWWSVEILCQICSPFIVKTDLSWIFLSINASPSDVTWKPFCNTRVTLNRFTCRPDIIAAFDNITQWILPECLWYPCQLPPPLPVSVLLSPTVTRVLASLRFVMFSSDFAICDVAPESAIVIFMSCYWFDVFAIDIFW